MEVPQKETLDYYNTFYADSGFAYYPVGFSTRVIKLLLKKCGISPPARILDIGCGTGFYSNIFHESGFDVTGIDISPVAIEKARTLYPAVRFEVADVLDLPYAPCSFDLLFFFGVSVANTRNLDEMHAVVCSLMSFVSKHGWLMFIGGSNLSGKVSRRSSWFNHTWDDIERFIPSAAGIIRGPFLTHFRIMRYFPVLSISRLITWLLRIFAGTLDRKVIYFVQKI